VTSSEAPASSRRRRRSRRKHGGGVGPRLIAFGSLLALASVGSIGVFTAGTDPVDPSDEHLPAPPQETLAAVNLVAPPEILEVADGISGLARVYGIDLSGDLEVVDSADEVVTAVRGGHAVLGAIPGRDGTSHVLADAGDGLTVLRDDLGLVEGMGDGEVGGFVYVVSEDVAARFELSRLSDLIGVAPSVAPIDPG